MTTIRLEVAGLPGVKTLLEGAKEATNIEKSLDEVGAILLNRIRVRFLNTTDPDGQQWDVSKAAVRRAETGKDGKTLFDTGALFNSLQVFTRGPGIRSIGTDVPYGPKHQEGQDGQPKRVFLGFSTEDVALVEALVLKRIEESIA